MNIARLLYTVPSLAVGCMIACELLSQNVPDEDCNRGILFCGRQEGHAARMMPVSAAQHAPGLPPKLILRIILLFCVQADRIPLVYRLIRRGRLPPLPSTYSPELKSLLQRLMAKDPNDRPSSAELLQEDFLRYLYIHDVW